MTIGWIIVQRWDDAEVVVGHGNHIYRNEEEAVHAINHLWKTWDVEVAKDPDAAWIKETHKPSLRRITWEEDVIVEEETAGDPGAEV